MLFRSFRGYRFDALPADVVAGVLLAAIAIPGQIATARLAGMPPETGLYAFVVATIAVVVLGKNAFLSVGADSTIAAVFAVTLAGVAAPGSAEYVALLGVIALVVGTLLVVVGIARAEWVSDLISIPVTVGVLAGVAIQIIISQLPAMLGISVAQTAAIPRLAEIAQRLAQTNLVALAFGIGVLATIALAKRMGPKIPGAIVALVGAGLAVALAHVGNRIALVGALHAGVPALRLPVPSDLHPRTIFPLAAVVAVVCIVQTVTTLRAFRSSKGIVGVSGDVAATGAGSILAAFVGAFPVDASPPRTAIAASAGARSQAAAAVAAAFALLFLAFGTRLTAYVPESAFAAVLIFIAAEIFQVKEMRRIARESRLEIALVALAVLLVVLLPINDGMILSIILSLFYGVYVMLRPPCTELVHVPGTTIWWPPSRQEKGERQSGVLVFSPAAPLYFMNVRYVVEQLMRRVESARPALRLVVIECSGVTDIDYTGAHVFRAALHALRARDVAVAIARLSDERALAAAQRSGIVEELGRGHVFKSANEAIDALA